MATEQSDIRSKKSFRHRVLRASAWTLIGHISSQGLRFASNLIMTRLLVPEMFGIMVLANVLLIGLRLLSDLGLRQNIVQHPRANDVALLNTIWTVQILRGFIIFAAALGVSFALYLLAKAHWLPSTSVYAEPLLPTILAVVSLNALINGFESTKYAIASRNMAMGKLTRIDLICQASGILFMVAWALIDRSIWALVSGSILTSLLRVILGNALLPGENNRLYWDKSIFREILGFGMWIFLSSILGFLAGNGDRLILGGLTDAKMLGMYSIAFFLVGAMRDVFTRIIVNVAFPALSEVVRDRPTMLKRIYYKIRHPVDIGTLLAVGVLFFSGHLLVNIFYDHRYFPAGHMLEILSINLFEVRYSIAGQCFMALGRPKLLIPIIAIQVFALYVFMPVAFVLYGFNGALWVAGGSVLFTLPATFYFKNKLGLLDIKAELRVLPWLALGVALGWMINKLANHIN